VSVAGARSRRRCARLRGSRPCIAGCAGTRPGRVRTTASSRTAWGCWRSGRWRRQDARRGAVVLLQLDHLQARIVVAQQAQVLAVGATPGVDRLVVVAHRGEGVCAPWSACSRRYWPRLVSWYSSTSRCQSRLRQRSRNVLVLAEQLDRQADQVVEIHRLVGAQGALVSGIEFRRRGFDVVGGIRQRGLGRLDSTGSSTARRVIAARAGAACRRCRRAPGTSAVVSAASRIEKPRLEAELAPPPAQDAHAERVKGADDEDSARAPISLPTRSFISFAALLVKVMAAIWLGLDAVVLDQPGDLLRDHARLARAGAGQHQHRNRRPSSISTTRR
jgi:hypothetical protein